jgi:hypothetical protein
MASGCNIPERRVDLSSAGTCDDQLTGGAERECVGLDAFRGVLNVGGGAPRCVGARSVP